MRIGRKKGEGCYQRCEQQVWEYHSFEALAFGPGVAQSIYPIITNLAIWLDFIFKNANLLIFKTNK